MARRVIFEHFGEIDQLTVVEGPAPEAGAGQVRVRVAYAGLNPVDWMLLSGGRGPTAPTLPSGNGNDFSGVVDQVGEDVRDFRAGDLVFGGSRFHAQADYVVVDASRLHHLPTGLGLDAAGGLQITGRTAVAAVRAIGPTATDTVFVSAAAGGVGVLAAQLAHATGAHVIGSASRENHGFLRGLGIVPVDYREGMWDRLRELAPTGVSAAVSTRDVDEVRGLVQFGVPAHRIDAIAAGPGAADLGAQTAGVAAALPGDLDALARAIARGAVVAPIDSVHDLEHVRRAYAHLRKGHLRGKVLLRTASARDAADVLRG